jgi:hypothetical protein
VGGVVTACDPWRDPIDVLDVTAWLEAARPAWHARANCRGAGMTDVMYPRSRTGVASHVLWAEATALCAGCPVINECGEAGRDESYGVWGGEVKQPRRLRTVTVGDCLRDGNWLPMSTLAWTCETTDVQVRRQMSSLRTRGWQIESRLQVGGIEYRRREP